jgi:hypothetical protein
MRVASLRCVKADSYRELSSGRRCFWTDAKGCVWKIVGEAQSWAYADGHPYLDGSGETDCDGARYECLATDRYCRGVRRVVRSFGGQARIAAVMFMLRRLSAARILVAAAFRFVRHESQMQHEGGERQAQKSGKGHRYILNPSTRQRGGPGRRHVNGVPWLPVQYEDARQQR